MTDGLRHLGSALAQPFLDPASRTWLPALGVSLLVGAWVTWRAGGVEALRRDLDPRRLLHPSAVMDVQLLLTRRLLALLAVVPGLGGAWWLATRLVMLLDRWIGQPEPHSLPLWAVALLYSVALFVAWDASRYVLHRLMHEVPLLWELHQVHHSAEVLTPLTFHRIHPLESVLYGLRGVLVTGSLAGLFFWAFRGDAVEITLFGVHGLGLALNALTGNLRHSHVWLSFGPAVERWLISPAQHQLHHSADPAHYDRNYGTWLALWDRLGGTLLLASERPAAFGVVDGNHAPDDLLGALLGPVQGMLRRLRRRPMVAAGLAALVTVDAQGSEPVEAPLSSSPIPDWDDVALDVIIVRDEGIPRVAGSAHVIDEEELELYEHDDIHRVLAKVPGVYVRGEDGFGLRPNIGIRGANSDRSAKITLLEDGVPLAPAPYAAPAAYYFPMATRLVGVEVFKGPAATRHGPQTVGGAINLLTRAVPTEPQGALDLAGGMRSTLKAHGHVGAGNERMGVLAEISHLGTAGFKELDGGGPTGFQRQDVMIKARIGDPPGGDRRHQVELKLGHGREISHETYLGLTAADFAASPYRRYASSALDTMRWQRTQAELSWKARIGEGFEARTVVYHHWLGRAWTKLNRFAGGPDLHDLLQQRDLAGQAAVYVGILQGTEDSVSADHTLLIGTNDRSFHSYGVQTVARHGVGTGAVRSELELGLRLHGDQVRRLHTEEPWVMRGGRLEQAGQEDTTLHSLAEAQALAAHVHEDLRLGRLHLLPSGRLEIIRTAVGTPGQGTGDPQLQIVGLPGMAVFGEVTDWMHLFAGVHRGFSPVAPGAPPETRPESSVSYELGVRGVGVDTHVELVGFFSDYANITGQCTLSGGCDPTDLDQQFNGGRAWVYGAEAVASHRVALSGQVDVRGELAWTWTQASFRTSFLSGFPQFGSVEMGDRLPYVPEHQGSARLTVEHPRVIVGVAAHGRGAMRDVAGQGDIPEAQEIPGAILLDGAVDVHVSESLSVYATGTNLTHAVVLESWRPFGARPSAPLQAMVGVKARF